MMPTAVVTPPRAIALRWSSGTPAERSFEVAAAEEMQVLINEARHDELAGGVDDIDGAERREASRRVFSDGQNPAVAEEEILPTEFVRREQLSAPDQRKRCVSVRHQGPVVRGRLY